MTDQKSHDSSIPKSNISPQIDVNLANAHEAFPRSSPDSTDSAAAHRSGATPSVSTLVDIYDSGAIDPAYQAKSHAISCAIQQIGMGRYQVRPHRVWELSSVFC
jgi:hypothetical protein